MVSVFFAPNIFTPYPGIPIWPQLRSLNVPEPKSLREWGDMPLGVNSLPWLQGKEFSRFDRMLDYFLLNNQLRTNNDKDGWLCRCILMAIRQPVRWRIHSSFYSFPWELWFARFTKHIVKRRSLMTGQALPTEAVKAC